MTKEKIFNKTVIKRSILLLIAIVAIVSVLCITASAAEVPEKYCREELEKLPNAEKLLYAYDRIVEGVESFEAKIKVVRDGESLTDDEIHTVYYSYFSDYPEHFWVESGGGYISSEHVTPSYVIDADEVALAKVAFENAANDILSGIDDSMTEFEKELYIHDTLINQIVYEDGERVHTAYGALVEGKAVCDGYAKAFQYLLGRVGIQSMIVRGYGVNERHAWNMVEIDGEFYCTDITWNDIEDVGPRYAYFNITTEQMSLDHSRDSIMLFDYPTCTATKANYYNVKAGAFETFTTDEIAKLFTKGSYTVRLYDKSADGKAFERWYTQKNLNSLAMKLGMYSGYTPTCIVYGREYVLTVEPKNAPPTIKTQPVKTMSTYCGGTATFKVVASGNFLSYQWYWSNGQKIVDGENISGADTEIITFSNVSAEDNQISDIYCVVSNLIGSVTSSKASANVSHRAANNDWTITEEGHYRICSCGAHVDVAAHSGGVATCTAKAICSDCGSEYGDLLEHQFSTEWSSDKNEHWHECFCGEKTDVKAHTGGTATCTAKAECADCGVKYGDVLEHQFSSEWLSNENEHWHECSCEAKTDVAPHIYGKDNICDFCGYKTTDSRFEQSIGDKSPEGGNGGGCGSASGGNTAVLSAFTSCGAAAFVVNKKRKKH